MGKTLTQWQDQVEHLVRDASNVDMSTTQIDAVGINPAIAQYSIDRPRVRTIEQAGTGSAYLALPADWVDGFSRVERVEFPARQNPPRYLDEQSWQMVYDTADVTVEKILLDRTPATSQYVRIAYTEPWPTPDGNAATDKIDEVAWHAVTSLAASFCCVHLAAEASRDRSAALAANFVAGDQRARSLLSEADKYRAIYDTFLGRVRSGEGGAKTGPVSRRFDFDPGRSSIFHGGRR